MLVVVSPSAPIDAGKSSLMKLTISCAFGCAMPTLSSPLLSIYTPTSTNISNKCFVGHLNTFLCKPTPRSLCRNSNLQMWLSFCNNGPCSTSTSTSSREVLLVP